MYGFHLAFRFRMCIHLTEFYQPGVNKLIYFSDLANKTFFDLINIYSLGNTSHNWHYSPLGEKLLELYK